jgi:hypothetical protein
MSPCQMSPYRMRVITEDIRAHSLGDSMAQPAIVTQ